MTQLLSPQAGESIYDPTCGTGGMLISALDEVKRSGGEYRTLKLYGHPPVLLMYEASHGRHTAHAIPFNRYGTKPPFFRQ